MLKTAPYTGRRGTYRTGLKFATVGFARNIEKKYFDKTYQALSAESLTGQYSNFRTNNGVMYISGPWQKYNFGGQSNGDNTTTSNDMLKGLKTGTDARSRIGNKINVKYIKGAFTFTAASLNVTGTNLDVPQGGESGIFNSTNGQYYLRTTFRWMVVKDLQVNSTDAQLTWNQVMDSNVQTAGIHSELNVDNMGRFVVLEDRLITVDADDPQKTVQFMVNSSKIGSVRYNGPSDVALTDKGIYVIWAAFVMGAVVEANNIACSSPVGHSRMCFTDD